MLLHFPPSKSSIFVSNFLFCNNLKALSNCMTAACWRIVTAPTISLQTNISFNHVRGNQTDTQASQINCLVVLFTWNQRCSSRSPGNHDRPAVQQGMWLFIYFWLDLIFALPLCQLLHHPLRCSTDRCCVFVIPLCRPDISGGRGLSLFWTRNYSVLYKHLTLLIFLIQGTDVIGKLCVLMLVQKSKVCILHSQG